MAEYDVTFRSAGNTNDPAFNGKRLSYEGTERINDLARANMWLPNLSQGLRHLEINSDAEPGSVYINAAFDVHVPNGESFDADRFAKGLFQHLEGVVSGMGVETSGGWALREAEEVVSRPSVERNR